MPPDEDTRRVCRSVRLATLGGSNGIGVAPNRKMASTPRTLDRRELLAVLGAGVGAALTGGCAAASTSPSTTTSSTTTTPGSSSSCAVTPSETEGPYPDHVGMINNAAFFRRDITE